jgi:conjugal transfer pilus assembly protein TraF
VRNASIEGPCLEELTNSCSTGAQVLPAAQALHVNVVPSVFLYVKPNTWLRLATGISTEQDIEARAIQFFSAYRNALLKGVENNQGLSQASVDFSPTTANGDGTTQISGRSNKANLPSQSDIAKLLGM